MTQPGGIPVDPEKLLERAYGRIRDLTLQFDQLVVAYDAQRQELADLREAGATTAPVTP